MHRLPVLFLRPQKLRGGGVHLTWSLLWPAGRWKEGPWLARWQTAERQLFAEHLLLAGQELRALLAAWRGGR